MVSAHTFRLLLAALLLGGGALPARALQLGESREQIQARHGAPGAEDRAKDVAIYYWAGWSAELDFKDGAVQKLVYRRDAYLQPSDVASLLQANGGVSKWNEVTPEKDPTRQWVRDDGATASCLALRPLMMTFEIRKRAAAAPRLIARNDTPRVITPSVPPAYSTPPSFPKLLGSEVEAKPAIAAAAPETATELRPLPRLATAGVAAGAAPETEAAPDPATPEPSNPAPAVQGAADSGSGRYGLWLGLLIGVAAAAGAAFYFFKLRRAEPAQETFPRTVMKTRREAPEPMPAVTPALDALRNDQFELLVGEIFRRAGYAVELSAAAAQGDSIDLTLRRDSETILVQCKHWRSSRVTEREIREFYGAMMANGAPRGIFVTAGSFSQDAQDFAIGKQIDLMDRAALEESTAAVARPGENFCEIKQWVGEFTAHARVFDPECPLCRGSMVIRHNRTSGAASWCCRNHPRCPGRREPRLDLLAAA